MNTTAWILVVLAAWVVVPLPIAIVLGRAFSRADGTAIGGRERRLGRVIRRARRAGRRRDAA